VSGKLVVAARRAIERGEEVTICYVDERGTGADRRAVLKAHYHFDCDCPRCATELTNR
jgi:hypothetical protein